MSLLKFGLCSMNSGPYTHPDTLSRVARMAEDAGFDSLWVAEHVVLPDPRVPPSPMEPDDPILDPVVALTFIAALTKRIRLGTGIIIIPQRNPLILAKELASLDVLSGGRLIFGVGVGYLEPEFHALGIPFEHRGARADEYLAAIRAIWSQLKPAYGGRFVSFSGVQAHPRPVQQPHPPLVVGGRTPAAYRRAVMQANGWYGYGLDLQETAFRLNGIRQATQQHSRPAHLGDLEISVTPDGPIDLKIAESFVALGVHRLILFPPADPTPATLDEFFRFTTKTLIAHI